MIDCGTYQECTFKGTIPNSKDGDVIKYYSEILLKDNTYIKNPQQQEYKISISTKIAVQLTAEECTKQFTDIIQKKYS